MEQLVNYKRRVASRFLPLEGDSAQQDLPESEAFIYSQKLDGHLGFAVVEGDSVQFYNRSGTALNLPALAAAFPRLDGIWAGELYMSAGRSRAFQVATAVASGGEGLAFAVFDAVHALEQSTTERIELVERTIPAGERVHPVAWARTDSRKEILARYQEALEAGQEGLIVVPAHGLGYKLKPIIELDVTVLGYSMKEDGSGIRSLLVGLMDDEGVWQVVASVGGGYNEDDRAIWLQKLEPMVTDGDILLVAKNRLAYKWVRPEIVIQIKCIEAIVEDATGTIWKERLRYDGEAGYLSQGKRPGVSLLSPVFQHQRSDKQPGADDTGLRQVSDRVEIGEATATASEGAEQAGEVLFRKVYTKSGKGGVAVRKFVGVRTHRDGARFPAYYVFFTDFSAGRKDPLKTDISLAADEAGLQRQLEALEAENVKKGWELAGG